LVGQGLQRYNATVKALRLTDWLLRGAQVSTGALATIVAALDDSWVSRVASILAFVAASAAVELRRYLVRNEKAKVRRVIDSLTNLLEQKASLEQGKGFSPIVVLGPAPDQREVAARAKYRDSIRKWTSAVSKVIQDGSPEFTADWRNSIGSDEEQCLLGIIQELRQRLVPLPG